MITVYSNRQRMIVGIAIAAILTGAALFVLWSQHYSEVHKTFPDKTALQSKGSSSDEPSVAYDETPNSTNSAHDLLINAIISAFNSTNSANNDTSSIHNDTTSTNSTASNETSSIYWQNQAQDTLRLKVKQKNNENRAKNVIFFLGDGMSIATITASRIYSGQKSGRSGEESILSFEKFPHTGLSKTYCVDKQVADSACSGTAFMCGVKGNFQTIGVNGRVNHNDCAASNDPKNQVHSLIHWAQKAKMRTGIITTTTITHATPAAAYAHVSNRDFECDTNVTAINANSDECIDIARQLIENEPGKNLNVIFGGGRSNFLPNTMYDNDANIGARSDGRNLINHWIDGKKNGQFVADKETLAKLDWKNTEHVLGLFASSHMDYNLDADRSKQPSLAEMSETAIKLLQQGDKGFLLFVEGGRIDQAHHSATALKALDETVEFSLAIERALNLTSTEDTLVVVTADHSHTMSILGYPDRGNPIHGLNSFMSDSDNLPMTTLSYANGPNYVQTFPDKHGERANLTGTVFHKDTVYPALFPSLSENHGGDDVAVFATGCMSHLFSGVYEQNTIPHLINYAACLGDGLTACKKQN